MNKNSYYMILVMFLMFSGCAKTSILVPGQLESDCDAGAAGLGVCGTPKNIYMHRDKVKRIAFEEDESYRVDNHGKIWNTDSGEEVIPGKDPSSGCVGCKGTEKSEAGSEGYGKGEKNSIRLQNRSLIVKTPQESAIIRDVGFIQSVWIAPHESRKGDLISAHELYVVVKKPQWIIGEDNPRKTQRGVTISSPLVEELFSDRHDAFDKKSESKIYDYVNEVKPKNLEKIENFIQSIQKEKE